MRLRKFELFEWISYPTKILEMYMSEEYKPLT